MVSDGDCFDDPRESRDGIVGEMKSGALVDFGCGEPIHEGAEAFLHDCRGRNERVLLVGDEIQDDSALVVDRAAGLAGCRDGEESIQHGISLCLGRDARG